VATTPQAFAADLTALPEHTAIHYRAVVESDFGTFNGPDRVLVTGVRLPGNGGGQGHKPPKHHKKHWPRIDTKVLKLRADGTVVVKMTCPASHGKPCKGTLRLTYNKHVIGRSAFAIKGGKSKAVTVKIIKKYRTVSKPIRVKVTAGTSVTTLHLRRA
jgi:hypothetical protein